MILDICQCRIVTQLLSKWAGQNCKIWNLCLNIVKSIMDPDIQGSNSQSTTKIAPQPQPQHQHLYQNHIQHQHKHRFNIRVQSPIISKDCVDVGRQRCATLTRSTFCKWFTPPGGWESTKIYFQLCLHKSLHCYKWDIAAFASQEPVVMWKLPQLGTELFFLFFCQK